MSWWLIYVLWVKKENVFYYALLGDSSILISFINALHAACECSYDALDERGLKSCNSTDINHCCVSGGGVGCFFSSAVVLHGSLKPWPWVVKHCSYKGLRPLICDNWRKGGMKTREKDCARRASLMDTRTRIIIVCVCFIGGRVVKRLCY